MKKVKKSEDSKGGERSGGSGGGGGGGGGDGEGGRKIRGGKVNNVRGMVEWMARNVKKNKAKDNKRSQSLQLLDSKFFTSLPS